VQKKWLHLLALTMKKQFLGHTCTLEMTMLTAS